MFQHLKLYHDSFIHSFFGYISRLLILQVMFFVDCLEIQDLKADTGKASINKVNDCDIMRN